MPQRIASPFQFGQAVLEPVVQPVYDRITLVAATPNGTFNFFVDPTAKTPREIFPGITTGGQLSAPRMMVVYGNRLHVDENIPVATQVADMKNIMYNSFYTFTVGIKDYIVAPFFWLPSGLGLAGFAASTVAATTIASATNGVPAFHSHFSIAKRRIAVPPQQAFRGVLQVAGAAVLAAATEIWNFLDTEFGFEVQ